jgi:maleylpyruvate isomerase
MKLHGYYRSSASYRVRIALELKGVAVEQAFYHLRRGEQRAPHYLRLNPQGLVPTLELDDGRLLTQSLAIIDWLDETYPEPPLTPRDPWARALVRAFALVIACEIHPVQNLKVLVALKASGFTQQQADAWARDVNAEGLAACEKVLAEQSGPFCFGTSPTLADVCLVPQLSNAKRFGVDLSAFPKLLHAEEAAMALAAFQNARPEAQPDAE